MNPELIICGTARGNHSKATGSYYAGPGNKFWGILHAIGLTPQVFRPDEYRKLTMLGIHLMDIEESQSGMDKDITFRTEAIRRFHRKLAAYPSAIVAFNGKKAAALYLGVPTEQIAYGHQSDPKIVVLPSTSGAACRSWNPRFWSRLAKLRFSTHLPL